VGQGGWRRLSAFPQDAALASWPRFLPCPRAQEGVRVFESFTQDLSKVVESQPDMAPLAKTVRGGGEEGH
jgi:hypothetical protein